MLDRFDSLDQALLDDFQRNLPLVPRPFKVIGRQIEVSEDEVIARLTRLRAAGSIARVGGTVRPNTAGASTLAAISVPADRIDATASLVAQEPGVNHAYLREHRWNLWFVATAPDTDALQALLDRIRARAGIELIDLRLIRPFNVDLGFSLRGRCHDSGGHRAVDIAALRESDRPILHALSQGLDLTPRPFATLARSLGRDEDEVVARIGVLTDAGLITRIGVIVRHRAVGWNANAMIVWDLPAHRIDSAGRALAAHPGVTLCYRRRTVPGVWPYGLYAMIHARSRAEALETLSGAAALPELEGARHEVLFSLRCFKQTGARIAADPDKAA